MKIFLVAGGFNVKLPQILLHKRRVHVPAWYVFSLHLSDGDFRMNMQVDIKKCKTHPNSIWTDELIQELSSLWLDGYSGTDIGVKLGLTRNQIMGKISRLGLVSPKMKKSSSGMATRTTLGRRSSTWTEEMDSKLREMWDAGYSKGLMSAELGVTKSALRWRSYHLNLSKRLRCQVLFQRERKDSRQAKREKRPIDDLSSIALHIPFSELGSHQCRYPYGNDPQLFTFCGHQRVENSSYCQGHTILCCREC